MMPNRQQHFSRKTSQARIVIIQDPLSHLWERPSLLLQEDPSDGLALRAIRSRNPVVEQFAEGQLLQLGQKTAELCILDGASLAGGPDQCPTSSAL